MTKRPKILLTNDDGIESPSIWELKEALSDKADCYVTAPLHPASATGHAISLLKKIRVRKVKRRDGGTGYGVEGTPADAIKFALTEPYKEERFHLVISGINLGPNTGVSVYYSGTIGAAREAVISGIPAFAVSVAAREWRNFSHTVDFTRRMALWYLANEIAPDYFLNVNIPGVPEFAVKGVRLTRQAPSRFMEEYEKHPAGDGPLYQLKGDIVLLARDGQTDQEALDENYISVTPLTLDLTHYGHWKQTREFVHYLEQK